MKSKKPAVFLDVWKTLVTSHVREPVWNLQRAIGHGLYLPSRDGEQEVFEPDDEFLRFCLTTPIWDKDDFVREAARRFGRTPTARMFQTFEEILRGESGCIARFEDVNETLEGLVDRGHDLGIVSNLWPFPANRIFDPKGLGQFFPEGKRIYSFEVRHRKPDKEIFLAAARAAGRDPSECWMVGDNLEADVLGAMQIGMKAALIDRPGEFTQAQLPDGVVHLRELPELLSILDKEEQS